MTTYRELISMVLDLLKLRSDDAYYTDEHILYLAKHMRALLLERKYKGGRNQPYQAVSEENMQHICIQLEPATMLPGGCGGTWHKSVSKIPDYMGIMEPKLAAANDMLPTVLTFIPPERIPYVGHNKWLKNIIYASRSMMGEIYVTSSNPQFMHLERMGMQAVFSDPEEASNLSCDCRDMENCDILDRPFPLEAVLITPCVEMIVQEIAGPRYSPEDKANNAKDDLSTVGLAASKNRKPAVEKKESDNEEDE